MQDGVLAGRYRRVHVIGRGAMGEVWLADDELLGRPVAIKTMTTARTTPDPKDLGRMVREARLAARLNHPNAVAVYDLVQQDDRPNLVLEYVPGQSLATRINATGGLPARDVAEIGAALADALTEAHRLGIVHRDVKPSNILITPRGVPKLADFGIARHSEDTTLTLTGMIIGTAAYVAPEVANGAPADARSDVWSLGVTLYAALTGRSPFQRGTGDGALTVLHRVINDPVPPLPTAGPVGLAVSQLLHRDPAERPDAAAAAALLRDAGAKTALADGTTARTPVQRTATLPAGPAPAPTGYAPAGYVSTGYAAAPPPPQSARNPPPTQYAMVAPQSSTGPPPGYPPTYPPGRTAPTPRRRTALYAILAGALVAAVAALVIVILVRGGSSPQAQDSTMPSGPPSSTSDQPRGSTARSTTRSTTSAPPPVATQAYTAKEGGITVKGPKGWQPDTGQAPPHASDYSPPGSSDTFFRIGVGNPNPKADFAERVQQDVGYLTSPDNPYQDVQILKQQPLTYQGIQAVEIEYTGTYQGVPRHVIERLWVAHGEELIIELNATANDWPTYYPSVFEQLVTSCTVQ